MRVVVSGVIFTKGFHQAKADAQFGFIGIEAVFDKGLGIQGEVVSEIVPHGDAGCYRGVAAEAAAAGWEYDFELGGKKETILFDKKRARNDGEVTKTFCGTDSFFVFIDVRNFEDHAEAFGECPLEFHFGFMFGEAIAIDESVIDEKIATRESRFNAE
jgi:hypothetical protein